MKSFIYRKSAQRLLNTNQEIIDDYLSAKWILSIALSLDGKYLFSCGEAGDLKQWVIKTGGLVKDFGFLDRDFPDFICLGILISKNGKYLWMFGSQGILKKICIKRQCVIKCYKKVTKYDIYSITETSDRQFMFICDDHGIMKQYHSKNGKLFKNYKKVHKGPIFAVKSTN